MNKKLTLPDVTLVCLETREYELMKLALQDCIAQVNFAEVLVCTDKPEKYLLDGVSYYLPIADAKSKLEWCKQSWYAPVPHLRTSHALFIQWDSWVFDPSMWKDEYLQYDYIGAPWPMHPTMRVGNSGFSLQSSRLKRYIYNHKQEYPCVHHAEDNLICRTYRPDLEKRGFSWAPEKLAQEFAFECSRPSPTSRHFGFHAAFNFGAVLQGERLRERAKLVLASPYISKQDYIMRGFCNSHPDLVRELMADAEQPPKGAVHA